MQFDALIVDPNPFSRSNLWQATLYEPNFRSVKAVATLEDALEHLKNGFRYDVLLITSELTFDRIRAFIPDARTTEAGKESAYVLVLKVKDQGAEGMAMSLLDGTDGLLLEPYSVNSLRQVAAIAAKVKNEHEKERAQAAIALMLQDIQGKLDTYAESKRKKGEGGPSAKELRKLSGGLKKVMKAHKELYATVAPEIFAKSTPRKTRTKYKGASSRVKKMEAERKD